MLYQNMQKTYLAWIFLLLLSSTALHARQSSSFRPYDLRCEHLERPMGIDNPHPRLSWKIASPHDGAQQSAYRILIASDSLELLKDGTAWWDSGKQLSQDMLLTYSGRPLQPYQQYYWCVEVWDKNGQQGRSSIASFEMGLLNEQQWQGSWISDGNNPDFLPAPYFRKTFRSAKAIKSARAYIAGGGLYELYINGSRIGDQQLNPMYTRFDRRILYVTHDVTQHVRKGGNAIGIILGNGWYNHQSRAVWDFDRAPWRNRPAFCLDLRITYEDGTVETITSGLDWKTSTGGLQFNSIYTGEHVDARLEQKGWNRTDFDDSKWHGVRLRSAPSPVITSQQLRPIRHVRRLTAQSFKRFSDKNYLFDFGQNMAGMTELRILGTKGTKVYVKHGERRGTDGHLDLSNIDVYYRGDKEKEPFQTDILTLSGEADTFKTTFNYKGFRYVEVSSDTPITLTSTDLTAHFTHSDVPAVGQIKASNPLVEKLWKAANNSYLSNLMGYPTDCPQREKNGWTGDGHFAIESAFYNFDAITIYEKWLADHRDEQQPNGVLPDIIPTGGWGYGTDNGLDWTSTIAIIPWHIYLFYGDSKALSDSYAAIKRYVDYVDRTSPNHLTSWGRGDWVPVKSTSNKELTSSIYFYVDASILAQAARLFNKEDDYLHYSALAEKIKHAINEKFLDSTAGIYANGTQTELSMPLYWGVVPRAMQQKVADVLAAKVAENGFHLDVGVLGAKALLNALSENGHTETAYKVAVQDTYPSWGWWIANGATTLLENWDLNATRDISDNHMMFGEIGAWFFKGLGGIYPDKENPGFRHVILKPYFVSGLEHFEASHRSPYGEIRSSWVRQGTKIRYEVNIPANSSATLYLPPFLHQSDPIKLGAGTHEFVWNIR